MTRNFREHKATWGCMLAALVLLCLAGVQYHRFQSTLHTDYQRILKGHSEQQRLIDQHLLKPYQQAQTIAHQVAKEINQGKLTPFNTKRYLSNLSSSTFIIHKLSIHYQDPEHPKHWQSYTLSKNKAGRWVTQHQDQASAKSIQSIAEKHPKGHWLTHFNQAQRTLTAQYQWPTSYTQHHRHHKAMVSATIIQNPVQQINQTFGPLDQGVAWLVDKHGFIIAYLDPNIADQDQIKRYEQSLTKNNFDRDIAQLFKHKKHLFNYRFLHTQHSYHVQMYPVAQTKLFIGYRINQNAIYHLINDSRGPLMWSLLWTGLSIVFICASIIYSIATIEHPRLWIKLLFVLFFTLAGIFVLYSHDESDIPYHTTAHRIDDNLMLQQFSDQSLSKVQHIPTGIEVMYIYNLDNQHVYKIKALVWQTLPLDFDTSQGPNILFSNNTKILESTKISDTKYHNNRQAMWEITLKVQHHDDMMRYPFDETLLSLQMLPKTFNQASQLVPDLDAYQPRQKHTLMGIHRNATMTDQSIQSSFFSFTQNALSKTIKPYPSTNMTPYTLNFNIELSRISTQTFFTYFIPLMVVLLLTYASLMVMDQRITSTIDTKLTFTSGIIVVLTLIHIRYHNQYDTNLFTYMDALLTYLYFVVLMVLGSIVLYCKQSDESTIIKSAARWFKAMFWPLSSITFLAITWVFFI